LLIWSQRWGETPVEEACHDEDFEEEDARREVGKEIVVHFQKLLVAPFLPASPASVEQRRVNATSSECWIGRS